ncbi:MAG: sigma-54-dependent Fis family transcriptional regulator [Nitrospirae bacterium]|nr:sigma-54-dependent Fis family transcriptional regulator [Nitrospirota bacterium]
MSVAQTVLLVDDEQHALFGSSLLLRSAGIAEVLTLDDSRQVMPLLAKEEISVMLLDLSMPFLSGSDLLSQIAQSYPELPVIILTAASELETAVQCMRTGAFDYLVKPVDKDRFIASVRMALEMSALRKEASSLKEHLLKGRVENAEAFSSILTANREMKAIFQYIEAIAPSAQPVLITGETGVGKELVARAVHDLSGRIGQFVALNVAGLDETTFSDTLFGHIRGAYTSAESRREGLINKASHGTLFLDEIGDLKDSLQVKLLRLLQDQAYYQLGSDTPLRSYARILVATNQNLHEKILAGAFRKDLFYRLRCHHVHIPTLRERKDDIPILADHYIGEVSLSLGRKKPPIPAELISLLSSYHFPGNVRELIALIHDAVAQHHGHGALSLETFRQKIKESNIDAGRKPSVSAGEREDFFQCTGRLPTLKEAEDYLIFEALRRANGNQGIAATMLGMTRQALNKRLLRKKP